MPEKYTIWRDLIPKLAGIRCPWCGPQDPTSSNRL
jgi:hypothetical protein